MLLIVLEHVQFPHHVTSPDTDSAVVVHYNACKLARWF
jgi:hypothetical protein